MQPEEVPPKTRMAFTTRSFLLRLAVAAIAIFFFPIICRAGGPNMSPALLTSTRPGASPTRKRRVGEPPGALHDSSTTCTETQRLSHSQNPRK